MAFHETVPGHHSQLARLQRLTESVATLRAELDCILAFSACPQDIVPINGLALRPTEAHVEMLD